MKYDVYGIGNALVDKEFEVTEAFLAAHGIQKGMMTLIDEPTQHRLLSGNRDFWSENALVAVPLLHCGGQPVWRQ